MTVTWGAAAFTAGSVGRQYRVNAQNLTVPGLASRVVPASATQVPLALADGQQYTIQVLAEERECVGGTCATTHTNGLPSEARTTRVDATAPLIAAQINGGAVATSDPSVMVDVSASDPATAGLPASGVGQLEVSQPGAFSCVAAGAASCRLPFSPSVPITLAPGADDPRTISVVARDAAATTGAAPPPVDGNASAPAVATILLDRTAPSPRVGLSQPAVRPGAPLAIGARRTIDGSAGPADSGVDPTGYAWSFGDGSVGAGPLVRHAYARLGTYNGTLSPTRLSTLPARRTLRLSWRADPFARFYNVQLYRARAGRSGVVRRRLISTFPRRPLQAVPGRLLRPGTYHLLVWSGVQEGATTRYARRPWIAAVLKLRPAAG